MPCYALSAARATTTTVGDVSDAMNLTAAVRTSGYRASQDGVSIALPSLVFAMRDPPARTVSSSAGPTGAGTKQYERQQLGTPQPADDHDDGGGKAWHSVRRYGVSPFAVVDPAARRAAGVSPPPLAPPSVAAPSAASAAVPSRAARIFHTASSLPIRGECSTIFSGDIFASATCVQPRTAEPSEMPSKSALLEGVFHPGISGSAEFDEKSGSENPGSSRRCGEVHLSAGACMSLDVGAAMRPTDGTGSENPHTGPSKRCPFSSRPPSAGRPATSGAQI